MNKELHQIPDSEANRVIGIMILECLNELWTQEDRCPEQGDLDYLVGLSMQMTMTEPKDNQVADHVNNLRAIARTYGESQQLREHLYREVYEFLGKNPS